jgi:uncharacterized protein (DUF58 family)
LLPKRKSNIAVDTNDLLKRVRKIEIKSRALSKNIFAGEYHSAFKGRGMAFAEVREYQFGDDIRNIDWNVTARFNHPFIKVFEEEREMTVMLLIDISGSRFFGTQKQLKKNLIAEVAAVLAFSAIQNNDKAGVILFSDKIEKFIPPKKGRQHILRIIRELIEFEPTNQGTNVSEALRYLTNVIKKKSTTFVISDFMDFNKEGKIKFEDALKIANRKHDVVALRVFDKRETQLPSVGLIKLRDTETNNEMWVDTSNSETREEYMKWWLGFEENISSSFKKSNVDTAIIATDEDYVVPLMKLFKKRFS